MAITASSVLASNSLEDFRIEFNNLVTDVNAIQLANTFDTRIIFEGSTVDGFETALTLVDPTADRSIVLPNVSGNLIVDGNPISANGESLGTASLEWSDAFFADGSILYFGADQDVTLTHVADTGLLLNTTMVVQFRDSAINIGSPADGDLDINADDEIELNSTLIDINGNVEISGTTAAAAVTTSTIVASGIIKTDDTTAATSTTDGSLQTDGGLSVVLDAVIGDDLLLQSDLAQIGFGADSEITLAHVHNVGLSLRHTTAGDNLPIVLQLKSEEDVIIADEVIGSLEFAAGDSDGTDGATVAAGIHAIAEDTFSASANATKLVFTTGVSETAASSATAKMTLSSAGLLTVADDLVIKTGGTIGGANDTDLLTLTSDVLTVAGEVVGTGFTGTLDGVLGGGTAAAATTTTLASTTITASGIIKTDDTTAATSTTDGSLQTDGGLSVAADAVIGDDLFMLSDAAVVTFGADKDVTITHVADTGLLLNAAMEIQFRDSDISIGSTADGDLSIAANDEIDITSTLIDINGNLDVSGTSQITGATTIGTNSSGNNAIVMNPVGDSNNSIKFKMSGDSASQLQAISWVNNSGTTVANIWKTGDPATNGTAPLRINSLGTIEFRANEVGIDADAADVQIIENGDVRFLTDGVALDFGANSEISLTHVHDSGLRLEDNDKMLFGTGSDLQIYHENTGNTGQIQESGAGGLYIKSDGALIALQKTGGEEMANFNTDGSVQLYFNNVLKFATSAVGVTLGSSGVNTTILTNSAGTSNLTLGATAGDAIQSGGNYNTLIGDEAGTAITTGDNNVAVGYQALKDLTTASFNTAVGTGALMDPTTGHSNTAVGYLSMRDVSDSVGNTGVGAYAGIQVTTGDNNTAVGHNALYSTTTAGSNVAIGHNAMYTNVDGATNVAVGTQALDANTSASNNVAIGNNALGANTTGADNTAIGNIALGANTTASNNTAVGATSLDANTTGTQNNAFGVNALTANTEGNYNCAYGANALATITTAGNLIQHLAPIL